MHDRIPHLFLGVAFGLLHLHYCYSKNASNSKIQNNLFHSILWYFISVLLLCVFAFSLLKMDINGIALIVIGLFNSFYNRIKNRITKKRSSKPIVFSIAVVVPMIIAIMAAISQQALTVFKSNSNLIQPDIHLPWTMPIQPAFVPYFIIATISLFLWFLKRVFFCQSIHPIRILQVLLIFPFPVLGPKVIVDQTYELLMAIRLRTNRNYGIAIACLFLMFFVKTRISFYPPTLTYSGKTELLNEMTQYFEEGRNFEALVVLIKKLESDAKNGTLDDQAFQMAITLADSQRRPDLRARIESIRFKIRQETWVFR